MTASLATLLTPQLVVDGLVSGMVFGLLAMGVVLVYRATRVINFAVGNMGMVGAGLLSLLAVQYGVPFWPAVALSMVAGTLVGALVELVVIRRLFTAPRVIVLVATIGVAQLAQAVVLAYPDIDAPRARFPVALGSAFEVGSVRVTGPQLTIVLVAPAVAAGLGWFMNRTTFGKSVKASAENRDLARLAGVSPKRVSLFVWAVAGGLSTLSLALVAGQTGSATDLGSLGQSTLVRALAAAVVAGMVSFPRAFAAGTALGVLQAAVVFNVPDQAGLVDFLILVAVLVAVYLQSRSPDGETRTFSFAPPRRPIPERLRDRWWARQVDRVGLLALGTGAVVLPLVVTQPSRHLLYTTVLVFALCGLSVTVLTGWAGQLSLGQMAFAGIGALLAAGLTRGLDVDLGWGGTRLFKAGVVPLSFGASVVLAAVATAALAALIGVGALRVHGLLLAVSTFAFGLAAQQYLYRRPILNGDFGQSVPFRRTDRSDLFGPFGLFGLDIRSQRTYYYVVLAVLAVTTVLVARLRRSGIGRTTIGVRDNPDGAAAYTVGSTGVKLRAFALAGGIAGLGGALLAGSLQTIALDRYFTVGDSLLLVALVVIGGLGSVSGPVLGAIWVVGLPAFFPDNDVVPLVTSSMGLLVLLLYFPGGLAQVAHSARNALLDHYERRLGPAPTPAKVHQALPAPRSRPGRAPTSPGLPALPVPPVLQTAGITVAFGGIHAVSDVAIRVDRAEIVGLIGTNGAGKSTFMNAIGGYVPSQGRVQLLGDDVSARRPHARARRGLGRSFQAATLFPELTVRETVQLALEARHRTWLLPAALALPPATRRERRRRAEADELVDFLGLGRYADAYVSDLSTGTRRIVELAGLLALEARLLCLDEPTAGLAQRETEATGPLIQEIRRELDAAVLVVEHDMPLIMGISDRVYCLELGRVIADGAPAEVRSDPAVIASYLGTDGRPIARSSASEPSPVS